MYLKALEIQGFKSFPQKTRLNFDKAVTAIVGPNGSGKSNLSDAVRWVMGEQSTKTLRGGKMEDVIFGGTQRRSQMGFAEVSLILDNSEHIFDMENSEVMITRRYYRSGESEYYINRQMVRLKDVNSLLMDTGLGKEGYSIIGQGRIDEILSLKSTDRRAIFEEAAGISRYRHRKEDSERKLTHAEENLVRVNDKIAELELQVEPLREQAETARKYLIFRDELRGLEISVWTDKLLKLQEQRKQADSDCKNGVFQLEQAQRELEQYYHSAETFSEQMREKDRETESVRDEISRSEAVSASVESEAAVLRENLRNNRESLERMRQEMEAQEGRDSSLQSQIEERCSRAAEIDRERDRVSDQIHDLTRETERLEQDSGENARRTAELLRQDSDKNAALSAHRATLNSLAASLQDLEDRGSRNIADINEARMRLENAEQEMAQNKKALLRAEEQAQSLHNVISGYTLRVDSRRKKAESTAERKMKLTMEMNGLQSRIAMLTEMEKEYQGYSKAVKIVMQEAGRGTLKNVHGPAADLVRAEDAYTVAIETALGAAAQNIIVDREEDGKAAILLLKRRDAGRATFLPMSTISGHRLNEKGLLNEPGIVGLAIDLVRYDARYRGIYENLLGRTAVAEDIDSAIAAARKYGNRFRIVTLDGQVMNAGGSMTGGSASKNAGILSRANELDKLKKHTQLLQSDLENVNKAHEDARRELTQAEYELSTAQEELRPAEDAVLKLQTGVEHGRILTAAISENLDALQKENGEIQSRMQENERYVVRVRDEINALEQEAASLQTQIQSLSAGADELSGKRREILDEIGLLRTEDASLEAERNALLQAVEELNTLRRDMAGDLLQQEKLIEEINRKNEEVIRQIGEKEQRSTSLRAETERLRIRLREIADEKLALEAERTRRDKETQEKNRVLLDLERESSRLEQKRLSLELEEKQLIDKLWDTYELSRTSALEQRTELADVLVANRRIGELKKEISKLGNPNIGAIDEFERVNTRYTYLTEQRDDITKAKDELNKIIGDITGQMEEIFNREFAAIKKSFSETFRELFGGGKASLLLEDDRDVLNCGIEIQVQPPGKSIKTITLLSGGEKAFVAIALYFAIIKVRPTPFVIMDEIEAALDEANVLRFAEYLRQLTDKTQFVVITHRRGTMEEADVLYGVTMQEQGVSQVLNVDLVEAEKAIAQ